MTEEAVPNLGGPLEPAPRPERKWVRLLIIGVLAVLVIVVIKRLLGDVDWEQVGDALALLHPWQMAVLVGGLLVRQFLNAMPLSLFIPGCSPLRAMQNDQAAILMTTVAPPPSDVAMRLAMFTSWGIAPTSGLAGTVMNTVSFYVVRFGAPLLGILLMLILGSFHLGEVVPAVLSGLVSFAILGIVWLAFRGESFTRNFAQRLANLVKKVKPSVDPQAWVDWAIDFRGRVVARVPRALPGSILAVFAMVLVDGMLIVLSLRFVGVSPAEAPAVEVLVAFLVAYPLTLFPFSGLGLLDAVVVATLLALDVGADEASLVAGFVVWRAVTILGPLLLGLGAVGLWKVQLIRRPSSENVDD